MFTNFRTEQKVEKFIEKFLRIFHCFNVPAGVATILVRDWISKMNQIYQIIVINLGGFFSFVSRRRYAATRFLGFSSFAVKGSCQRFFRIFQFRSQRSLALRSFQFYDQGIRLLSFFLFWFLNFFLGCRLFLKWGVSNNITHPG
ncbi:hypothetical protein RhiirA5_385760 [Rhizophagus irregularis]|uniref:Uncharacterized protein n=1 Tax=Rhizophagus irregularis TaxID=588596 RepID=A0A2N0NMN2_9GLOM|nr:hypothetical protein RhiirA5_385760 [Rhizophagus irregularis]